jgi:pimeloyl-ACP methyl ester carboxylesterase
MSKTIFLKSVSENKYLGSLTVCWISGIKKLAHVCLFSISTLLLGCSPGSDSDITTQPIAWAACPKSDVGAASNLECGNLSVPLDWAKPSGEKITLGLIRSKATDAANRLGSIVVNPGGPGASAFDLVTASMFSERLRARFDIVAMDPRGVGHSTPIKCPVPWNGGTLLPQTEAQFAQMASANRSYYEACKQATGELIDHVDTISVVHDLDSVRQALGEQRLNFVGLSYGTAIAETYARTFPNNVRALVLDGVLDYSLPVATFIKSETDEAEEELARFATACQADSACPLYGAQPLAVFDQTVARANAGQLLQAGKPISGEIVTGATPAFLTSSGNFTSSKMGWAALAAALSKAQSGDVSTFADLYSYYQDAQRAIACLDKPVAISTWADYQPIRELGAQSPHLAGNVQTLQVTTGCIGWGAPALAQPVIQTSPINGDRMLLVTSTHDPSTPASWAEGVHARLPGSSLIYREGDGHTSYSYSACIRDHVDQFLITGTLPSNGQRCAN